VRLRALAPGKINLSLFLGEIRADGRHDLVTLFESVSLADELSLSTLPPGAGGDEVVCPGVEGPNLVSAALAALRDRGWDAPPVRIEIVKRIPVAAGMGGGSADAAAALRLAVELAPGRAEEVAELAAALGSDVPSQLVPGLSLGTGAGEVVEPFEPLEPHAVLVLPQPHALSTADVYRAADRLGLSRRSDDLGSRYDELVAALNPGARLLEQLLVNDLEPAALSLLPDIDAAITATREAGADRSLVCGSGPTVVGLFWGRAGDGAAARARAEAAAEALVGRYPAVFTAVPVEAAFGAARQVA
jgi:4-diphosphocytidyl-2-C-methyl-D-erythritol kinase